MIQQRVASLCFAVSLSFVLTACGPGTPPADTGIDVPDGSDGAAEVSAMDATDTPVGPPIAYWQLPRTGPNEFMLPWPSDLTLASDGTADFSYIPNPASNPLVITYQTSLAHRIAGFSTVGATYFRFSVPIDPTSLPASTMAMLTPGTSIAIVDVDPTSPDRDTLRPAQFYLRTDSGRYWSPNTLAVAPAYGFPLRPNTTYAVVITDGVHAVSGGAFGRDVDFAAVMSPTGGDASIVAARTLQAPALAELTMAGIDITTIVSLAVFTTQDPTDAFFRAVGVAQSYTIAQFVDIAHNASTTAYDLYHGHYGPNPNFQTGALPYTDPTSGDFTFDSTGAPVVQGSQNYAFTLSVPTGTPPTNGWPVVVYADGTGGNNTSFVDEGPRGEGVAQIYAQRGMAVFSFDQIFNGERTFGDPTEDNAEIEFFNFNNPLAGRTNNRQAGIDLVAAGRFVRQMVVPAMVAAGGADVHFDADHVMFFGHSQGGLCGPLWVAAEDGAGAAIFSGAGATFALSIVEKTEPVDVPTIASELLGIPTGVDADELVPLHPVVTMAQTAVDVADPVNYGRFIIRERRPGLTPRHVFQTEGFVDHYAPDDGIASLALAIGLQLTDPVLEPVTLYPLGGIPIGTLPFHDNLAGGTSTGAWSQFEMEADSDGHFVIYDIATARNRAANFLQSYSISATGDATISP